MLSIAIVLLIVFSVVLLADNMKFRIRQKHYAKYRDAYLKLPRTLKTQKNWP